MAPPVAAGVVAFRPEADAIVPLVRTALEEASPVFVFVNGVIDAAVLDTLRETAAEVIVSPHNLGVAEAFNMLALAALLRGRDRLVLFDQDSAPPPQTITALAHAKDGLDAADVRAAVVGPAIVSSGDFKPPRYFEMPGRPAIGAARAVRYLISSGSLIDLGAFRRIGRFRSDFFIDAIDTEWCFRAWARGFSCWVLSDVAMPHRIGQGVLRPRFLGPPIPKQHAFRYYAYLRNQAACLTLPHIPLGWKARFAVHAARLSTVLCLSGKPELGLARLVAPAFHDGFTGKLGPPPGAEAAPAPPF